MSCDVGEATESLEEDDVFWGLRASQHLRSLMMDDNDIRGPCVSKAC